MPAEAKSSALPTLHLSSANRAARTAVRSDPGENRTLIPDCRYVAGWHIRYDTEPGYFRIHVVDGGFVDTGDKIIEFLEKYYKPRSGQKQVTIQNMVLSHADNDHAGGLLKVLEKYPVGTLWMNRPWLYAQEVIDSFHGNFTDDGLIKRIRDMNAQSVALEELAIKKKTKIEPAFQGAQIGNFTVLAPNKQRYIASIPAMGRTPQSYAQAAADSTPGLFKSALQKAQEAVAFVKEAWGIETLSENPEPTTASNECCVVQYGKIGDGRLLLTADAGPIALKEAADYAAAVGLTDALTFVQIPHHGSRRNVTPTVLNRWLGQPANDQSIRRGTAYVSVGSTASSEYPRRSVANAFCRRGYHVFSTGTHTHLSHSRGGGHADLVPATPLPFFEEVEA